MTLLRRIWQTLPIVLLAVAAFLVLGLQGQAAKSYDLLIGQWRGSVKINLRSSDAGGKPTQGIPNRTATSIEFKKAPNGLTGTFTNGDEHNEWTFEGNSFVWSDSVIKVTTKAMPYSQIPDWVRRQSRLQADDLFFAFRYTSCERLDTGEPCKAGKEIAQGLSETGIWLFRVAKNTLYGNVYHSYFTAKGGKRIFEQELKRVQP